MLSQIVSSPGYPADPGRILTCDGSAFVKYFDLIFYAFRNFFLKRYPINISFTLEFKLRVP